MAILYHLFEQFSIKLVGNEKKKLKTKDTWSPDCALHCQRIGWAGLWGSRSIRLGGPDYGDPDLSD